MSTIHEWLSMRPVSFTLGVLTLVALHPVHGEAGDNPPPVGWEQLPKGLAEFAEVTGAEMENISSEDAEAIVQGEADYDLLLSVLRPTQVERLSNGFSTPGDSSGVTLFAASEVELVDGTMLPPGSVLPAGGTVLSGMVVNPGPAGASIQPTDGGTNDPPVVIHVPAGGAVLAGCLIQCSTTQCSTTCGDGYYACCMGVGGCARCLCVPNGTSVSCDAGGPGATSCSGQARHDNVPPSMEE